MIDSENSTSAPSVSRRTVLTGAISSAAMPFRSPRSSSSTADEPIRSLWREWQRIYAEAVAWSERAGSIEHAIARSLGFPRVRVPSPPGVQPVWATTHGDIDAALERAPVADGQRRQLHSDLSEQQVCWDAASEAQGLNNAQRNEIEAWDNSEQLAEALFELPAKSLIGVMIKLNVILHSGEARVSPEEHPWPQIRCVSEDVRRLAGIDGCST